MTNDELAGLIRQILTLIGGALVAQGWLTQGWMTCAIGVVMAIVMAALSVRAKRLAKDAAEQAVKVALYSPVPK